MQLRITRPIALLVSLGLLAALPMSAEASHSWGDFHWARTSNPLQIAVVDSMTSAWDDNLDLAIGDWDASSVLAITQEAGGTSNRDRKRCRPISGKVRSCNAAYGFNGWLGLAQIWTDGSHISKAIAKMNDSYLSTGLYDETARQHVICQEIGHAWGLHHQSESGADLDTCMDYARALDNPSPNAHDYEELETIYGDHLDANEPKKRGRGKKDKGRAAERTGWGRKVHQAPGSALFVRSLGKGKRVFTHVVWAQ